MKKIKIMAMLLMGLGLFTACETDRDDNPVLLSPDSFELFSPELSGVAIDLANSQEIVLKAKERPNYGAPVQVTMGAQIALKENASEEEIRQLEPTTTDITYKVTAAEVNKAILEMEGVETAEDFVEGERDLYVRMTAQLADDLEGANKIYSNWQKLKVVPFFQAMVADEPQYWWLIGGCIGDGTWGNSANEAGYKACFPLPLMKEYEYATDGTGHIAITLFVPEGGIFKMIQTVGSWDVQVGMNDGEFAYNDGGSGNIVPTDGEGFYRLEFDTKEGKVVSYEKVDGPASTYSTVSIIGLGGDWETDIDMTPAAGAGLNNHMWTAVITVNESTIFKMRADHSWDMNWGYGAFEGEVNTSGFATNGGQNIGIEAGTWAIYLDDITGFFRVVAVQ